MEDNLVNSRETMPENLSKGPERTKPENSKNSSEKTKSETSKNSPDNSSRNSPENIPEKTTSETTSNNFPENVSETTKKIHPDEDVDPFKLFNIPKQNVYVPPEIVPPAAEAAIRYLKPPEPIVLTELIEPETEKLNQIEQQMQEL